jgi:hypothetical protein
MNELSRIPFGLRLSDQQFVDASEVERGRKCNCICPSCKTPLITRQGEVNEWHFAHVSKGVSKETENECEYSFWVSVNLMAKRVIETALSISVPSFVMYTSDAKEVKLTEQKEIFFDNVKIEQKMNSVSVDAILKIGEFSIFVIFTTPNKPFDNNILDAIDNNKAGILEISLSDAYQWLFGHKNQGKYTQALKLNILSNVDCKRWLYHPRKLTIEKQHNIKLQDKRPVIVKKWLYTSKEPIIKKQHNIELNDRCLELCNQEKYSIEQKEYKCVMCGYNWFGTHKCIYCKTHLYSKETR